MTTGAATWVLGVAVVLGGLLAGVYAGFALGVMPGLAAGPDEVLVATMQQVNRAIVNPAFLALLFAAPAAAVIGAVLRPGAPAIAGAVLAVATLVVTIVVNVPLNDALAAAPGATTGRLSAARAAFEAPWVRANLLRTVSGVLAEVALLVALVRPGR
jgi:uncharacterized membrane protein